MVLPQGGGQLVDLLFGALGAKADADDAAGGLLGQLQGCHHVAGLTLVAGGAGGDADALAAEVGDDVGAGPAHQGHGQHVGCRALAGDDEVGNGGQKTLVS